MALSATEKVLSEYRYVGPGARGLLIPLPEPEERDCFYNVFRNLKHPTSGGDITRLETDWNAFAAYYVTDESIFGRHIPAQEMIWHLRSRFPSCPDPGLTPATGQSFAEYEPRNLPAVGAVLHTFNPTVMLPDHRTRVLRLPVKDTRHVLVASDGVVRDWESPLATVIAWPMKGFDVASHEGPVFPYLTLVRLRSIVLLEIRLHVVPTRVGPRPETMREPVERAFRLVNDYFVGQMSDLAKLQHGDEAEAFQIAETMLRELRLRRETRRRWW